MKNTNPISGNTELGGGAELDAGFWNSRWQSGKTGWDIGHASPPITEYLKQYDNKDAPILIPGCGNAYEAAYMIDNGFTNVTLVDISDVAVTMLMEKFKAHHQIHVLCGDFFRHTGSYDLILEQTFFCAQVLGRRSEYVRKMHSLLNAGGRLVGVLFGVDFGPVGPPFGGTEREYRALFEPLFDIQKLEPCYNSIAPRAGAELFINLVRK